MIAPIPYVYKMKNWVEENDMTNMDWPLLSLDFALIKHFSLNLEYFIYETIFDYKKMKNNDEKFYLKCEINSRP